MARSVVSRVNWFRRIPDRFDRLIENLERRSVAFAVFLAAVKGFNEDNCTHLAAGVAYYAFFSIFPLILGLIALSSFLLQSAEARDAMIAGITQLLPGTADVVRRNIDLVLRQRGTIGLFATITLLWSAKSVFAAIATAVNLAWNVKETRPFLRRTALELGMVFAVGFFLLASFGVSALFQFLRRLEIPVQGTRPIGGDIWSVLVLLLPIALSVIAFFLVYRFVPNIEVTSHDVWPGAITAGVLFAAAQNVFLLYTTVLADYELVYGSLAAVITLLFWAWISAVILLFGAEICAAYTSLRRARDTT